MILVIGIIIYFVDKYEKEKIAQLYLKAISTRDKLIELLGFRMKILLYNKNYKHIILSI